MSFRELKQVAPYHLYMQIFTIGTFGMLIIQFYKNDWLCDTSQRKKIPMKWNTLGFLGWRDSVYYLKRDFYAYDCKNFPCQTIQTYNLPRQAIKNKSTKILKNHHISSLKHLLVQSNAFQSGKILSAVSVYLDFKKCKKLLPIWCGNSLTDINHFFFFFSLATLMIITSGCG